MNEFTAEHRFWLRAFPRGVLAIGATSILIGGGITVHTLVCAYQAIRVAQIKADIVQSITDGAVTIVQTIVTGGAQ